MKLVRMFAVMLTVITGLIVIQSCGSTDPPKTGTIQGDFIIKGTAARPDAGTVQVSLFASWDTSKGIDPVASGGMPSFSTDLIAHGVTSYRIENITLGEYSALAASWRDTTRTGLSATSTVGAWGADPALNDTTPAPIVLTEDNADLELDIVINYDLISAPPTSGYITGTVTLNGTWPAESVYIVVLTAVSPGPVFAPMGQPAAMVALPAFTGSTTFTVPNVPFGTYAIVGAYKFAPPSTFIFIGGYGVNVGGGDMTPESVTLSETTIYASNVDFTINP
jgi:hypothetical protein